MNITVLNKEIARLGAEIQSISLSLHRISLEEAAERDKIFSEDFSEKEKIEIWRQRRQEYFRKRRKAIDALNKRVMTLEALRRKRRELFEAKAKIKVCPLMFNCPAYQRIQEGENAVDLMLKSEESSFSHS